MQSSNCTFTSITNVTILFETLPFSTNQRAANSRVFRRPTQNQRRFPPPLSVVERFRFFPPNFASSLIVRRNSAASVESAIPSVKKLSQKKQRLDSAIVNHSRNLCETVKVRLGTGNENIRVVVCNTDSDRTVRNPEVRTK